MSRLDGCGCERVNLIARSCRLDRFDPSVFGDAAPWVRNISVERMGPQPYTAKQLCDAVDDLLSSPP
jgi:hypothetical protein